MIEILEVKEPTEMLPEQVEEILKLAFAVNGFQARTQEDSGAMPTVFVDMSGHIAILEIKVHEKGWRLYGDPTKKFEFRLDRELDEELFNEYKDFMEGLLDKSTPIINMNPPQEEGTILSEISFAEAKARADEGKEEIYIAQPQAIDNFTGKELRNLEKIGAICLAKERRKVNGWR